MPQFIYSHIELPCSLVITAENENDSLLILEIIIRKSSENEYRLVETLNSGFDEVENG